MPIFEYNKGKEGGRQISPNFHSSEFDCPCCDCHTTLVNSDLVEKLESYRSVRGAPVHISSGYRCHNKQEQLRLQGYETAVGTSQHELGNAADISDGVTPGFELEDSARKAGFSSVGVGKTFIHVDTRPGHRRWTYKT